VNEIIFNHVYKEYDGGSGWAVEDVSLRVPARSLVVFLGPSGCGKTTLLKMVNRLVEPTRGEILMDGMDIREQKPTDLRRRIGYSIQQVGLMPHMTVERNIGLVPRMLDWPGVRIRKRVLELMALMNLDPDVYLDRYPAQLSGGQQQRVGIARALAADPELLLMDEPFGALDAITRLELQNEICRLQTKLNKTVLFVTHDVDEALRLADYLVVLQEGRLIQFDRPIRILQEPRNDFVCKLLNTDDRIRQLGLLAVTRVMMSLPEEIPEEHEVVDHRATVREALSLLLGPKNCGLVVSREGKAVGWVTLEAVRSGPNEGEA